MPLVTRLQELQARAGVGTNGILACKFQSKTRTVPGVLSVGYKLGIVVLSNARGGSGSGGNSCSGDSAGSQSKAIHPMHWQLPRKPDP
jgi:hypothetical protein